MSGARRVARRGLLALCDRLQGEEGRSAYVDGRAVFETPEELLEVVPPFVLVEQAAYDHVETGPLRQHLAAPRTVGLLAVRLGGYAAAVYHDEELVAGRGGSRFVKNRNKKGGSSSNRFRRRREEQARDLHDRAAALAEEILLPRAHDLDHLVLAGDRFAVRAVLGRSPALEGLAEDALVAPFQVPDLRSSLLEGLGRELWSSAVSRAPARPPAG